MTRRPYILFQRASSSGAHGLRRRSALAAFQRVRAFLERATDCPGARGFDLRTPRTLDREVRDRFPAAGEWHEGRELSWSGGYRGRPDDAQTVVTLDTLESIIAWLAPLGFVATLSFGCLLRDPRTSALLPYTDDDFSESPGPWTRLLLFLEEDGRNALSLELAFPTSDIDETIVAVHDIAVETLGIAMPPSQWLRYTPSKRPGKSGTRKKIHFDRNAWVSTTPVASDDRALLAQIVADLDSDDARQIYADVLIARGDPRGTFINTQCQLARLIASGGPGQIALERLAKKLLREHGKDWQRVPAKLRPVMWRGFVDRVEAEWVSDYTRSVEALLAVAPTVTGLSVTKIVRQWDAGSLVASFGTLPLRRLSIGVEPGVLAKLSTVLPSLRHLDLRWSDRAVAGELAMLCEGSPTQLETLALSGPALEVASIERIAASPRFSRLARVHVDREVPPADIERLQRTLPQRCVIEPG